MQDSGYFSDTFEDLSEQARMIQISSTKDGIEVPLAALCQHAMHPVSAGQTRLRCPVCVVDVHLRYVKVLTQALQSAGGRAPSCTLVASDHQDTVYSAWQYGKICALGELSELEQMADREKEWSAHNPELKADNLQTAQKALDKYWTEFGCPQVQNVPTAANKRAVFAQDTDFQPGRPQAYYWKRSPRYEPGKYSVAEQSYNDDEIVSEDSEDYSQATVIHYGIAKESALQYGTSDQEAAPFARESDHVIEDDDDDSDWEDIESDEESSDFKDCVYFGLDEQTNFIVFGEN